jgi:hypothetical protein
MPIYMNRSEWDRLSEQEKSLRLAEGVILRDDDWQEQQARRERAQAELAEWRAEREKRAHQSRRRIGGLSYFVRSREMTLPAGRM